MWDREYGSYTAEDVATALSVCSDGGFILAGWTESSGVPNAKGQSNIWVVKTDSNGFMEWNKTFGDSLTDAAFSIFESKYGGYYFAGAHTNPGDEKAQWKNFSSPYIVKLDRQGNTIWEKTYGLPLFETGITTLRELDNGNLIACGRTGEQIFKVGYTRALGLVMKVDSSGKLLWRRNHFHPDAVPSSVSSSTSQLYDIHKVKDGGYVAVGQVDPTKGGTHIWLIKMDSMGCLVAGCDTLNRDTSTTDTTETLVSKISKEKIQVKMYPNPASSKVNLLFPENFQNQEVEILLYNILGKIVFQKKVVVSGSPIILNTDEFKTGLYLIRVFGNNNNYYNEKLLIEH